MKANWSRYSGVHSAVAPQSMSTGAPVARGHHRGHGRPADTLDALGHQRGTPRAAPLCCRRRTKGVPLAVPQQGQADGEGGAFFLLEGRWRGCPPWSPPGRRGRSPPPAGRSPMPSSASTLRISSPRPTRVISVLNSSAAASAPRTALPGALSPPMASTMIFHVLSLLTGRMPA